MYKIVMSVCFAALLAACPTTQQAPVGDTDAAQDTDDGCPSLEGYILDPALDNLENTIADCTDGKDQDGDGFPDCDDQDCNSVFIICHLPDETDTGEPMDEATAANDLYEGNAPGECEDGADNDGNGDFDCDDENCAGAPACQ